MLVFCSLYRKSQTTIDREEVRETLIFCWDSLVSQLIALLLDLTLLLTLPLLALCKDVLDGAEAVLLWPLPSGCVDHQEGGGIVSGPIGRNGDRDIAAVT